MSKKENIPILAEELVMSKIYTVRGQKVMLDRDLAELYQVETKRVNEQVKRNSDGFQDDFVFELTQGEWENLKSQIATSSWGGRRTLPAVFTEHGILMLSSVLNSSTPILVNIQNMRQFVRMRELYTSHKELMVELEKIRGAVSHHHRDIRVSFKHLKKMEQDEEDRGLLARIAKIKPIQAVGVKAGKGKSDQ